MRADAPTSDTTALTSKQRRQRERAPRTHGLFVRSARGLRLRSRRTQRLVTRMFAVMPWLQPSDEATARAWAGLEVISASLLAALEQGGLLRSGSEETSGDGSASAVPRRLLSEYRQFKQTQLAYAKELGMTPAARASLGLTVSAGRHHDVATELAALRVERDQRTE